MNTLGESSDHRAPVDYHLLLQEVKKNVEKVTGSLLQATSSRVTFDIDSIAYHVASHYPKNPLFFEPRKDNLFVSTYMADLLAKTAFTDDILQLRMSLYTRFQAALSPDSSGKSSDPIPFLRKLFTPIQDFAQEKKLTREGRDPQGLRYGKLN